MIWFVACIFLLMAAFAAAGFGAGVSLGEITHCDEEDRS